MTVTSYNYRDINIGRLRPVYMLIIHMLTCPVSADSAIHCTQTRELLCLGISIYDAARANKLSVNGDDRNDRQPMKHRLLQRKIPRSTLCGGM